MGIANSCDSGCGRHAHWRVDYDHVVLEHLRNKARRAVDEPNFIDQLRQTFRSAAGLGETIESVVGPVHICQSIDLKIYSLYCEDCYQSVDLEALPKGWGYKSTFKIDGYHRK